MGPPAGQRRGGPRKEASDWPTSATLGAALALLFVAVSVHLVRMGSAPAPRSLRDGGDGDDGRARAPPLLLLSRRWLMLRAEFPTQPRAEMARLQRAVTAAVAAVADTAWTNGVDGGGPPTGVILAANPGSARTLGCFCRALRRLVEASGTPAMLRAEGTPSPPEPRLVVQLLALMSAANGGGGGVDQARLARVWEALGPGGRGALLIVGFTAATAETGNSGNETRDAEIPTSSSSYPLLEMFTLRAEAYIEEGGFVC